MSKETVKIPDLGGGEGVEVIEICVAVGDTVSPEESLVVLESDKASMEVPAPFGGEVLEILVKEGDQVSEGDELMVFRREGDSDANAHEDDAEAAQPEDDGAADDSAAEADADTSSASDDKAAEEDGDVDDEAATSRIVALPDIGADSAEVIEICVSEGDDIAEGDSIIVLETDKASMEVPSPAAGKVIAIKVGEGDQVGEGAPVLELEVKGGAKISGSKKDDKAKSPAPKKEVSDKPVSKSESETKSDDIKGDEKSSPDADKPNTTESAAATSDKVYAGPAVRRLSREFGVPLEDVKPSGPRGRVLKEDLQRHVKARFSGDTAQPVAGSGIPPVPEVDFAAFGEIETRKLTGMEKATATNMHRSWVNVPHVTHFDEADITELEAFRKDMKAEAEKRGVKLTPMPFLLKAIAVALRENPRFCASIQNGEWVQKKYCHIGMAVDTPAGLLVPVIRDVDQKTLWELSAEIVELAGKARDRKLKPDEMKGGCFTISSLGNIGGTGFTPVVNAPELGILGVSKAAVKPVWNGSEFAPRTMLPLCLSYDHKGINGGDAGRFMTFLVAALGDIRRLLL